MRINFDNNVNSRTFGAQIKVDNKLKEMMQFYPLKEMKNNLEASGTHNVYELGKYSATDKLNGTYDVLLNGDKFGEISHKTKEGLFTTAKNFLQKSLEKENSILAEINPQIGSKLNKIRQFVKETGLDVENVKKWL